MTAPLVFLDTETTGLELEDEIWEFAAIRRDPDGTETGLHLFIQHDTEKCSRLPVDFRTDHGRRFPAHGHATPPDEAALLIYDFLYPQDGQRVHVVGAVPNFDTERLSRLLRAQIGEHTRDPWHYHLIDVENLAIGALAAMPVRLVLGFDGASDEAVTAVRASGANRIVTLPAGGPEIVRADFGPPWDSDEISRALGVEPPTDERHTAMGDARWARAIYDRVMGVTAHAHD